MQHFPYFPPGSPERIVQDLFRKNFPETRADLIVLPRLPFACDNTRPPNVGDVVGAMCAATPPLRLPRTDARIVWRLRQSAVPLPDTLSMPMLRRLMADLAPDMDIVGIRAFRDAAIALMLGYVNRRSPAATFECPQYPQ